MSSGNYDRAYCMQLEDKFADATIRADQAEAHIKELQSQNRESKRLLRDKIDRQAKQITRLVKSGRDKTKHIRRLQAELDDSAIENKRLGYQIEALRRILGDCKGAITALDVQALGMASVDDRYEWPIRDELLTNIGTALEVTVPKVKPQQVEYEGRERSGKCRKA